MTKIIDSLTNSVDPSNTFASAAWPDWDSFVAPLASFTETWLPASALQSTIGQTVLYTPDGETGSAASAGGAGGGTATSVTSAAVNSPFVINITWDSSVASAPAAFKTAVLAAAQYLESQFTDPVTLNISVGYGEVDGSALGNGELGTNQSYLQSFSYTTLRNALVSDAKTSADLAAVASLPATSPVSGTIWTTASEAKALGLAPANGTATDGFIGFSSTVPFAYDESSGVAAGTYDFNGVALHEMTEVMGRMLLAGGAVGTTTDNDSLLDLFHYSASGVRDFSASTPGYFSDNGGVTNQGSFNTAASGDAGDWASSVNNDSFDAFLKSGVVNAVTANDLTTLDVIGWNQAAGAAPAGAPVAVAVSDSTGMQASTAAVAADTSVANVTHASGAAGDMYTYALGGMSAGLFTLTDANGAATLGVGAAGLPGAASGFLYGITVTETDATIGSSATSALNVIVGSTTNETVNAATLSGALGLGAATFVYGLAGADRIDGTGMTGRLWIDGGAGADTLSGGSGVNDYLYNAVSDSTDSLSDVITNFHAAVDTIDLTGLSEPLTNVGLFSGSTLAARSVGWQANGGNTFVYVNTGLSAENLGATDMRIELAGAVSLSSGNIVHL